MGTPSKELVPVALLQRNLHKKSPVRKATRNKPNVVLFVYSTAGLRWALARENASLSVDTGATDPAGHMCLPQKGQASLGMKALCVPCSVKCTTRILGLHHPCASDHIMNHSFLSALLHRVRRGSSHRAVDGAGGLCMDDAPVGLQLAEAHGGGSSRTISHGNDSVPTLQTLLYSGQLFFDPWPSQVLSLSPQLTSGGPRRTRQVGSAKFAQF